MGFIIVLLGTTESLYEGEAGTSYYGNITYPQPADGYIYDDGTIVYSKLFFNEFFASSIFLFAVLSL